MVTGEVSHPRSKLTGYSTEITNKKICVMLRKINIKQIV